jgi:hypothetical protein
MEGTTADPGVAVMWRTNAREPPSAITSRSKPKSPLMKVNAEGVARGAHLEGGSRQGNERRVGAELV